jgi:protoporphyrinogen IX oxidase
MSRNRRNGYCRHIGRALCGGKEGAATGLFASRPGLRYQTGCATFRDPMTIHALAYLYPWTKALHVIAMIAWMAATFYMPRLFVYHCDLRPGSAESERFKVMEYRLFTQIMNPAMILTWLFGITLVLTPGIIDWSAGWWHVKLLCVILMSGFHGAMSRWRKDFLNDANRRSQKFYRIANEIPTVLMVVIVIMVIVRPF